METSIWVLAIHILFWIIETNIRGAYIFSKSNIFFLLLETVSKLKSMASSSAIDMGFQEPRNSVPKSSSAWIIKKIQRKSKINTNVTSMLLFKDNRRKMKLWVYLLFPSVDEKAISQIYISQNYMLRDI